LGAPLFTGEVIRQSPVTDDDGADLSVDYVNFPKGVHNKMHKHSNDQVLIVISGKGIIANKDGSWEVQEGDVIWTPAGEEHYHGAAMDSDFTHISITRAHTKLTQIEK
jgi:quercetin dioxygenase-like cupin family protein